MPLPDLSEEERDHLFALLWEQSLLGLAVVGADGKWLDVNPTICNLLGYTRTELLRKTFQEVTHPDDVEVDVAESESLRQGVDSHETYTMRKRYIPKQGAPIPITLKVTRVSSPDGTFRYFLSQIQRQELVQEKVVSLKDVAKAIRDASPDPVERLEVRTRSDIGGWVRENWRWLSVLVPTVGAGLWNIGQGLIRMIQQSDNLIPK